MSTRDLPPPPERPQVSPPAAIQGEDVVTLEGLSGEPTLEARVRAPAKATRSIVLCHPHPLYGGTMHSAVVVALAKVLAERGAENVATLRFNYRGVGKSEGNYDQGRGETLDARAAIRALRARAPNAKMTVCGYSFGTWVGLRAAAIEVREGAKIDRVALVAPAVRIFEFVKEDAASFPGSIAIYIGDNDEFCDVAEAEDLARSLSSTIQIFPGADHYFLSSRRKLADAVVPWLAPEIDQHSP